MADPAEGTRRKRARWDAPGAGSGPATAPVITQVPGASSSAPGGSGAPPPKPAVDLDAIAKAKKALELQKQLAERLKKIPKAAPPGAKPAPVQDALPQPSADEEWYLARRAARHSRPRALEFVDRGKYQLQAEFNRAVARGETEEAAMESVKALRGQIRKQERLENKEAIKMALEEERRREDEAEKTEVAGKEAEKRAEMERRIRQQRMEVPDVEWWDARILAEGRGYDDAAGPMGDAAINEARITAYVEHPVPLEPPAEAPLPPPQPLKLTQREMKKLRTQRRLAREKERQELVKQGLLEPPKPKVKISNLHRVLGAEAAADPTAVEREVRRQMAERQQAHNDRNLARMLTPAEKREKKIRKMFDETPETVVAVFKIGNLVNKRNRFKVEINAEQNHLTGRAIAGPDGMGVPFALVVVEGCMKSIRRYTKLMEQRIDWGEVLESEDADEGERVRKAAEGNGCRFVWQGSALEPAFKGFRTLEVDSEASAVGVLRGAGCEHFWSLAKELKDED